MHVQLENGMEFLADGANSRSGLSARFLVCVVNPLRALPIGKTGDVSGTVRTVITIS